MFLGASGLGNLEHKDPRARTLKITNLLFQLALLIGTLDGDCKAERGTRGLLLAVYFLRVSCLIVVPVSITPENFIIT